MKHLTALIKPVVAGVLLCVAPAIAAQQMLVRPGAKPSKPKVTPVNITQVQAQVTETNAKASARKSTIRRRKAARPNVTVSARQLPPVEFTQPEDDSDINTPRLNLDYFTAPRPDSPGKELAESMMKVYPVGTLTVSLPECISIFETRPDFVSGAMNNLLEVNTWLLDSSYKLSTPQAYANYIAQLYGGIESNQTQGNRTDISGYDTKTSRNYHVRMVTDGDKLYVARVIYLPALERHVSEYVIPRLLTPSNDSAL